MITPGPWRINGIEVEETAPIIPNGTYHLTLALVYQQLEEAVGDANRKAIAAVPDMIEALKRFLQKGHSVCCGTIQSGLREDCNCGYEEADSTLVKVGVR